MAFCMGLWSGLLLRPMPRRCCPPGPSAVLLGLALSLPFWCGALLVAVGSVLNYLVSARK